MSIIEAQRFLQDACWDDISRNKLINIIGQTDPSDTALARLAQDMVYAVTARDINELKNSEKLTRKPKHDRYTRLVIGGQAWHVCNLFLNDGTLERGEEEEDLEEWNECGCKLNYITAVQANGNLLIGKAYTAMLDLRPGDKFELKLGGSQIRLVPLGDPEGKSDDDYVSLSTDLEREGDYEGAIAAITVAINLKPRMAPWYLNRAQTWMAWHRWSEAIQDCTTALVDCDPLTGGPFPFRCVIYSQRAIARVGMGDWSAACADWQALLADRPGDIEALVGLTLAYGHLDQSQQAENYGQEVSARLPSRGTFNMMDWFAEQCLHPWQGPLEVAMRQLFAEMITTREEDMGHLPVVSSNVGYIAYNPETSELQVAFKHDTRWSPDAPDESWEECRVYKYSDVPAHIFAGLKNADSKGSYVYHNIAFSYQYERTYA